MPKHADAIEEPGKVALDHGSIREREANEPSLERHGTGNAEHEVEAGQGARSSATPYDFTATAPYDADSHRPDRRASRPGFRS